MFSKPNGLSASLVLPLDRVSWLPNVMPYHNILCNCNIYSFSFYPMSFIVQYYHIAEYFYFYDYFAECEIGVK